MIVSMFLDEWQAYTSLMMLSANMQLLCDDIVNAIDINTRFIGPETSARLANLISILDEAHEALLADIAGHVESSSNRGWT